mgnify:CR=1 FL=1
MTEQENKIKTLLDKSGIPTHLKAINFLKTQKWPIIVSPYYYDDFAKSAREIDIIAERIFENQDRFFTERAVIAIQLFVECKFICQEILIWFDKFDKSRAIAGLEKETGLRIAYDKAGGYDISWNEFHYLKHERVAKLFSANANNEDVFYKAISQSLLAKRFYTSTNRLILKREERFEYRNISRTIRYPVILCDNFQKLFEVKNDHTYEQIPTSFLLEVYYNFEKSSDGGEYVLIDVVDINKLDSYLETLKTEIESLVSAFQSKTQIKNRNQ